MKLRRTAGIIALLALVAGCGPRSDSRPILTKEVFFAAAKKCHAIDPTFSVNFQGELPTFSFAERSPATGECIADALKNYQFASMMISAAPKSGS